MRNNNHYSKVSSRGALLFLHLLVAVFGMFISCSSVDCPLNNTVYANYKLMGKVKTLPDTLTIWTSRNDGNDTILINQQVNTDSFTLPVSYARDRDILYFRTNHTMDTVTIDKTNIPHFESVDCGMQRHTLHTQCHRLHHHPKPRYHL